MIQSMTGYGKATAELPDKKINVEIKSLNSKAMDLSTRIAPAYREKEIEIRNYDRLFVKEDMNSIPEDKDYKDFLNPESLTVAKGYAEPALLEDNSGIAVQFERAGYYYKDPDSTADKVIFNKTTALKDSYKPE